MITLKKAFRIDENTVKVLYVHNELKYEFVVEWSNIHPATGKIADYDLQLSCLSSNESFSGRVIEAIRVGEDRDFEDCDLYLAIRDAFDRIDCESL